MNQKKQIPLYDGQRFVGYMKFENLDTKEYAVHDCQFAPDPAEAKIGLKRGTACPHSSYGCDYVAPEATAWGSGSSSGGLAGNLQLILAGYRRVITIRWQFGETIATGDGLDSVDDDSDGNWLKG